MVSSIAAELDQKACWEVLTDPRVAERHFSADERQIFRRHVLWTRVIRPRNTSFPDGSEGDLLAYLRRERETLVIKPNRACGGEGVLIGPATDPADWESAIDHAIACGGNGWVVQQLASLPVSEFPVIGPDGAIHSEPFHVVMGFAPTQDGVAITVRASQKQVVNVAQRGGMCVVFVGRPARPLQGPAPVGRGTAWNSRSATNHHRLSAIETYECQSASCNAFAAIVSTNFAAPRTNVSRTAFVVRRSDGGPPPSICQVIPLRWFSRPPILN
jgi:hypothetical protein